MSRKAVKRSYVDTTVSLGALSEDEALGLLLKTPPPPPPKAGGPFGRIKVSAVRRLLKRPKQKAGTKRKRR